MFTLFLHGWFLECYYIFGSIGILAVFECAVITGALAHAYVMPYEGLVGCSPGVYGIIGCGLSQIIMDYDNMDNIVTIFALIAILYQVICDVFMYFYWYVPTTAYEAHIAGMMSGFSLGAASYFWKKTKLRKLFAGFGIATVVIQVTFLSYSYRHNWPPMVIDTPFRSKSIATSCCSDLYSLIDGIVTYEVVIEQYICRGDYLESKYEL